MANSNRSARGIKRRNSGIIDLQETDHSLGSLTERKPEDEYETVELRHNSVASRSNSRTPQSRRSSFDSETIYSFYTATPGSQCTEPSLPPNCPTAPSSRRHSTISPPKHINSSRATPSLRNSIQGGNPHPQPHTPIQESTNSPTQDRVDQLKYEIKKRVENNLKTSQELSARRHRSQSLDRLMYQNLVDSTQYLVARIDELADINKRLEVDVEALTGDNESLVKILEEKKRQMNLLEYKNKEQKINIDRLEGEKDRLRNEKDEAWLLKVKAEQTIINIKKELNTENRNLKEKIDYLQDEESKLRDRISELEKLKKDFDEQLSSSQKEWDTDRLRLKKEIKKLKTEFDKKARDFEIQCEDFLALKKSFNDLLSENDKLKKEVVDDSAVWKKSNHICSVDCTLHSPNSTWATSNKTYSTTTVAWPKRTTSETMSIVDLTDQLNSSIGSSRRTSRGTMGSLSPDNIRNMVLPNITRRGKPS